MRFKELSHSSRSFCSLSPSSTATPDKIKRFSARVIATYNCLFFSAASISLLYCFIFLKAEVSTSTPSSLRILIPKPKSGKKLMLLESYLPLACNAGRKTTGNSSPFDLWIVMIVTEFFSKLPLETSIRVSVSRIFPTLCKKVCRVPPCFMQKSVAICCSFLTLANFSLPNSWPINKGAICRSSKILINKSGKGKVWALACNFISFSPAQCSKFCCSGDKSNVIFPSVKTCHKLLFSITKHSSVMVSSLKPK